jgi:sulfur-carrier protein
MATIKIPTPLRQYVGGQSKVEAKGDTVGVVMAQLVALYPDLKQHLYEGDTLRSYVNIYLGEEDVRALDGMETAVDAGANLRIIPSIAGGR